ncbi:MAG: signal transduction histidine kinase/DNA-binding response OmpR family regulator, partial [Roseivirga sp.]
GIKVLVFYLKDLEDDAEQEYYIIDAEGAIRKDEIAKERFSKNKVTNSFYQKILTKIGSNYWTITVNSGFLIIPEDVDGTVLNLSNKYPQLEKTFRIFEDNQGAVWVITELGIFRFQFKQPKFQSYLKSASSQSSAKSILGITATINGGKRYLWAVREQPGELWRVDLKTGSEKLMTSKSSLKYGIDVNNKGELLSLSNFGLEWINPNDWIVNKSQPLPSFASFAWLIHEDKYEKVWFQGPLYRKLYYLQDEKLVETTKLHEQDEMIFIYHMIEDETDIAWLVGSDGLHTLNIKTGEIVAHYWIDGEGTYKLPVKEVYHMLPNNDGTFWLATNQDGLILWSPEKGLIKRFTRLDGLSSNIIYAVYKDSDGLLWMLTDYGISSLDYESEVVHSYSLKDGLSFMEFNRLSHHQDGDGNIYFGSLNGVTRFNPIDFSGDSTGFDYPLAITGMQVFSKNQDELIDLTSDVISNSAVTLKPGDFLNNLSFSLLSYEKVDKVTYAYKIEGLDKDWNYQKENNIRLGRLPYGNHNLTIKAQTALGNWSNKELVLSITVQRPVYLQLWFVALSALLLITLIKYIFWYRAKKEKESRFELETLVRERTETIEFQKEELQSLDRMKSRFFANISHELRTPLTLIMAPLANLLRQNEERSDDEKRSLGFIKKSSEQLLMLVNEILDLSKLEQGKLTIDIEAVNLYDFFKESVAPFYSFSEGNGINLTYEFQGDKNLNVEIDRNKVRSVIQNYMANAFKFSSSGGLVKVVVKELNTEIQIQVHDTGIGISQSELEKVFDRFYQADQRTNSLTDTMEAFGGTGIGLALSYEIAKLLEGRVWVESQPNQGSSFFFEFPKVVHLGELVIVDQTIELLEDEPVSETFIDSDQIHDKPRLLIVEDNSEMRQLLTDLLNRDYRVQVAHNGKLAWDILVADMADKGIGIDACKLGFDMIISDQMMPEMDGLTLLKKIKENKILQTLPFIMLTARAEFKTKLTALRTGVDDYLLKPFVEEELIARINNLLVNYKNRESYLLEGSEETVESEKLMSKEDQKLLERIEEHIQQNMADTSLSVSSLAFEFAMSDSTLLRTLKRLTGLTPQKLLSEIRLKEALRLLESREFNSVNKVSTITGFSDVRSFSRNFKTRFGKTPSDYLN